MLTVNELYDLSHSLAGDYLKQFTYPWEALAGISDLILEIGKQLPQEEDYHPADWDGKVLENVWVAKDATVFKTAYLHGPCIIGHRTEVRQCAFIRGSALVGNDCVVGNSTELKNVILFDNVQVPHYNYVGDSILGYKAHMGAGSITSNVKSDKLLVVVKDGAEQVETALDALAEDQLYQAYHKMTEKKSAMFISHRLASTRFCDTILMLENGKIVESGTHEELLAKKGSYAKLFEVQSRYYREGQENG